MNALIDIHNLDFRKITVGLSPRRFRNSFKIFISFLYFKFRLNILILKFFFWALLFQNIVQSWNVATFCGPIGKIRKPFNDFNALAPLMSKFIHIMINELSPILDNWLIVTLFCLRTIKIYLIDMRRGVYGWNWNHAFVMLLGCGGLLVLPPHLFPVHYSFHTLITIFSRRNTRCRHELNRLFFKL